MTAGRSKQLIDSICKFARRPLETKLGAEQHRPGNTSEDVTYVTHEVHHPDTSKKWTAKLILPHSTYTPSLKVLPPANADLVRNHCLFYMSAAAVEEFHPAMWKRAASDIAAIRMAFPVIQDADTTIVLASWLAFLCGVDDEIATMSSEDAIAVLSQSIDILKTSKIGYDAESKTREPSFKPERHHFVEIGRLTEAFLSRTCGLLSSQSYATMMDEVCDVWRAMSVASACRTAALLNTETYLGIRMRTVGLLPFFTIVEHNLFDSRKDAGTRRIQEMEALVNCAVGLQNDIVGLERDITSGDRLNLISVVARAAEDDAGRTPSSCNIESALFRASELHNVAVKSAMSWFCELSGSVSEQSPEFVFASCLLDFISRHFTWASSAKRYQWP